MKGILKVTSVKQVKGFIHENSYHNFTNENRMTKHVSDPIALLVTGFINGKAVSFFSPTVIVDVTTGFLNYKSMPENKWFELIEEETKVYHGAPMFDGGDTPNVAIQTKSTIVPRISIGDEIEISYSLKGEFKEYVTLTRVKII